MAPYSRAFEIILPETAGKQPDDGETTAGDSLTATLPVGNVDMTFVYISPGKFQRGSPSSESGRGSDESPQHEVTISKGFYLGKYEVTQGQWQAVMGTTPWSGQSYVQVDADNPAVYVSWNDVQSFVQTLNDAAKDSLYRLPTEAEWEYACRAGTTARWSFGDEESKLKDYAWYYDNAWNVGEQYAHEVGTKLPSPWGLFDMHGNVWEWCMDWYGSYSSEAQVDPLGPDSGSPRVLRGGCFFDDARLARSAFRGGGSPGIRDGGVGFRLLRRAQ
ncbi:MAG: formylglycine-generating enzyme family protein [Candidatus Latescibacteria bacterium]|nr:formylglycine-generating enzyme family protein [Candidatus Latescibacterota bacterium]